MTKKLRKKRSESTHILKKSRNPLVYAICIVFILWIVIITIFFLRKNDHGNYLYGKPLDTFITFTAPDGWGESYYWSPDPVAKIQYQVVKLSPPKDSSDSIEDTCTIQLDAVPVADPLDVLRSASTDVSKYNFYPSNIQNFDIHGFNAVRYNQSNKNTFSEHILIAVANSTDESQNKIVRVVLFCPDQSKLDRFKQTQNDVLESLKFR